MKKSRSKKHDALAAWLMHPGASAYFGREFEIKIQVLAHLVSGEGSLAAIARSKGVSRQAAHRHAQLARKAFGFRQSAS